MTTLRALPELISLKGKRALITGSAAGIGKAIAYRFAEAGADLELVDIDDQRLAATKKELEGFGTEVSVHQTDISSQENIDKLWERLSGDGPDVLVNNRSYAVVLQRVGLTAEHAEHAEISWIFSAPSAFSAVNKF